MGGFEFDDLEDLIEADIQYGLFEEDGKIIDQQIKSLHKKQKQEIKSFFDIFKV